MTLLFGLTLFFSAFLLFSVQPMIGRMVLPLLGGVPSVWNGCMLFFQAMLLAGYAYAHLGLTRLGPGKQRGLHLALLVSALFFLPPAVAQSRVDQLSMGVSPVMWLLVTLGLMVAFPFAVLSATAPMLLRWFSRTAHPSAKDPHFLYAASNLGSLAALALYPVLVEPAWSLSVQARAWSVGVGVVAVLVALCASVAARSRPADGACGDGQEPCGAEVAGGGAGPVVWWVVLAAVPSSLVLGVTQYITTDLASIPLFWVVPLGVYLVTFVLAFARRQWIPVRFLDRAMPVLVVVGAFLVLSRASEPVWMILGLHLLLLFGGALWCHGRLASLRPGPVAITRYYLCISVGGVAGGLFNSLLAPAVFRSVAEYAVVLVVLAVLRVWLGGEASGGPGQPVPLSRGMAPRVPRLSGRGRWWMDVGVGVLLGAVAAASMFWARVQDFPVGVQNAVGVGIPLVGVFGCAARPLRFGLGLALVLMLGWDFGRTQGVVLRSERTFFGVTRVTEGMGGQMRFLVHGNTLHGRQWVDPVRQEEPLAYYHRRGPAGDLFDWLAARADGGRVGVVGLGAGAMAAYARPAESWVFFEIDPAVIEVARDTNCFTYLSLCKAGDWRVEEGDARLRLGQVREGEFDLLAVDAFSSDAIPVHLMTREAVRLYVSRVKPGGLVAFHISNRYVELAPVLGALAADAGMVCRSCDDWDVTEAEMEAGRERSEWLVLARREEDLGLLKRRLRWLEVRQAGPVKVWTDDYANLLGAFRW